VTHERTTVAIIGLGLLGEALARRLLAAQLVVSGFDIDAQKTAKLAALGGLPAPGITAAAESAQFIILAVFSTEQVETVVERELSGVLGDNSSPIVLCASTCDPDRIERLGARVVARGMRFLETPVSGSSGQVSRGEGVGLVGGDAATLKDAERVLRTLFATYFHIGRIGDAGRAKLAVNLILGLNRLAVAEGLVFAERLGLDPASFLRVARASACYSQVMDIKGAKMLAGDFAPEGRVSQHLKDVHLMLEQAQRVQQQLPLLEIHAAVLEACVREGEGDLDNSIVIEEIRRRGQLTRNSAMRHLPGQG
jgi:3-hydroxyisobutyrate dehydrogenase-like beta-hydroxyacid dehydrogenase